MWRSLLKSWACLLESLAIEKLFFKSTLVKSSACPFEILSKTKINDAYHEYVKEGAKYVIVVICNMYDLV